MKAGAQEQRNPFQESLFVAHHEIEQSASLPLLFLHFSSFNVTDVAKQLSAALLSAKELKTGAIDSVAYTNRIGNGSKMRAHIARLRACAMGKIFNGSMEKVERSESCLDVFLGSNDNAPKTECAQ